MWAVRYEDRRIRVFTDMVLATRFFQKCEAITCQIQLYKLIDTRRWESIAWTNPPTGIKYKEEKK